MCPSMSVEELLDHAENDDLRITDPFEFLGCGLDVEMHELQGLGKYT